MSQQENVQAHDQYRENIIGRANVADNPELLAYYQELEKHRTGALWTIANKIEPWQPKSASVPVLWRYSVLREHGVDPDGSQCIWQDGLDIPLVNVLEAGFYKVHPDLRQAVTEPVDASVALWGAPALRPQNIGWDKPYSPLFKYQWEPTYAALQRYARVSEGSPFDDILMHYTNPLTGGHVMPTLGASMQLLRPGFVGKAHRHTGSFIYQVAKGQGYSVIDGQRFDWQVRDIFCVPSWAQHEHVNTSQTEDACLFCFNDLPVIQALQLYYEETLTDNDGHQRVGGERCV
ncbi:cupin domain-containing protein [Xenorhabdus siamensis]|uniref:cupin domain-containing protein n=1 Tax=Xenorhabdus siamensis TaxID=3136254 RepID=UPI0030F4A12D